MKDFNLEKAKFEYYEHSFYIELRDKDFKKVNKGVNILLDYIKKNSGKRVPYLAKRIHKPPKTIERWLKQLRDADEIEFRGSPKKGGYWVIK